MGILTIFFSAALIVFLPLGQLLRIPIGNGLTIVGLDVIVSLTSVFWIFWKIIKKQRPQPLFFPIFLFVLTGILSLLVNIYWLKGINLFISFLYLIRWFFYASFIWISFDIAEKSKKIIKKSLIIGGGLVMILGLLQYLFFPSLTKFLYLGWDDHYYRIFSTFLDPNFTGTFLVLYFFFVLSLLIQNWEEKHKKIFYLSVSIPTLVSIFLTYSRSAYLMLLIGLIVYLWVIGQRKIISLIIALVFFAIIFLNIFHHFGEGNNLLRTSSIASRLGSMSTAINVFEKEPIFGVGFNSYRYAQRKYGFLNGNIWEITHAGSGTSNSFLFVLATSGILGLCTYLFFVFSILRKVNRKINKQKITEIMLFSSFVSLLANSLFENTLFYPSIMLWIFCMVGFMG